MFTQNKLKICVFLSVFSLSFFSGTSARATELDFGYGYFHGEPLRPEDDIQNKNRPVSSLLLPTVESSKYHYRLERFNATLSLSGFPLEPRPMELDELPPENTITQSDFQENLGYIDGFFAIKDYLTYRPAMNQQEVATLELYNDFSAQHQLPESYLEYKTTLKNSGTSEDSAGLMQSLAQISQQSKSDEPLKGLKVAIDPGHMGGDFWDKETGKFVKPVKTKPSTLLGESVKVSEADLNLNTAFLVATELEQLGAEVLITRTGQTTVTSKTMEDSKQYWTPFRMEYIYGAMDSWLFPYNKKSDSVYMNEFQDCVKDKDRDTKWIDSNYYIQGEDLQARIEKINAFKPTITLDIHYDADTVELQHSLDEVKTYIPGGFMNTNYNALPSLQIQRESGSRKTRALALKHLLEPNRWNESKKLAQSIVSSITTHTGVEARDVTYNGFKVSKGVFTRNLYITLHSTQGLIVYIEGLNYDYTEEYERMIKVDQTGIYHGIPFNYPKRIAQVAKGISDGVIRYFHH